MAEKRETIISTNKQLKVNLSRIIQIIEETFSQEDKACEQKNEITEEDKEQLNEALLFKDTVDKFKKMIEDLNNKITMGYQFKQIKKKEDEVKNSKIILTNIQRENSTLRKIKTRQNKGITDLEEKYSNQVEMTTMNEKIKNVKQELKMLKDFNMATNDKIKLQLKKIDETSSYCELIKSNIKRQKSLPTDGNNNLSETGMMELEQKIHLREEYIKNEETHYLTEIRKQKDNFSRLCRETEIIKVKIKQKEQEIRINELKIKELHKLTTQLNRLNQENTSVKTLDPRPRKLNLSTHFQKYKLNNRVVVKSENYNYPQIKTQMKNNTSNKYICNRGNSDKRLTQRIEANQYDEHQKQKNEVLLEIENLRKNIQSTLDDNIINHQTDGQMLKVVVVQKETNIKEYKDNANAGGKVSGNQRNNNAIKLNYNNDDINFSHLDQDDKPNSNYNNPEKMGDNLAVKENDNINSKIDSNIDLGTNTNINSNVKGNGNPNINLKEKDERHIEDIVSYLEHNSNNNNENDNNFLIKKPQDNDSNNINYPILSNDKINSNTNNNNNFNYYNNDIINGDQADKESINNEIPNDTLSNMYPKLEVYSRRVPFKISGFNKDAADEKI